MPDRSQPVTAPQTETDLSGRQVSGYRLLRRLGQGAMAEVYLAEQISLGRQVAFKVLRANLATDATYVQRFDQEARAAAQLVHPNIVQIYEVGRVDGVHFIAQEYVQGVNLAEWLARRGLPDVRRALGVMRQVAAALDRAAARGIVHRDIKPENIMLAANGEVKVADFGLARLYSQENANNLTQIGVTMGTPLYMSPEQVEGRALDPRSDIYALGVTSYQMFAGETPFRGDTALAIAVQHLKNPPERLENRRPDLPAAVSRIVHKMLAKDPGQRYATPRELLNELRATTVELFPDDAPQEFDDWADSGLVNTVEARRDATQRLAAAMRTTAMPAVRLRRSAWRWAAAIAGCLLVGAALAWAARPRSLLVPIDQGVVIPAHETAAAQYVYAVMLNTEDAWKSVPHYFPNDKTYSRRATQHLAMLYLQELDFENARKIFDQFALVSDVEQQYKAWGLAGQAIVLNRLGQYRESASKLALLWPLRDKLEGEMRTLVAPTFRSNQKSLGVTQAAQGWETWFEKSAPPPAAPGEASPPPTPPR